MDKFKLTFLERAAYEFYAGNIEAAMLVTNNLRTTNPDMIPLKLEQLPRCLPENPNSTNGETQ